VFVVGVVPIFSVVSFHSSCPFLTLRGLPAGNNQPGRHFFLLDSACRGMYNEHVTVTSVAGDYMCFGSRYLVAGRNRGLRHI
jgi:hypothetical protein